MDSRHRSSEEKSEGHLGELHVDVHADHETISLPADGIERLVLLTVDRFGGIGREFRRIDVVLSNRTRVTELNRQYLNHDYPTDVLSFCLTEAIPHEGEVYIDLDTASERFAEFGSTLVEEAHRYIVHGVLHLLGLDDGTSAGKTAMKEAEDRILVAFRDQTKVR